jgi:hypothetical protein
MHLDPIAAARRSGVSPSSLVMLWQTMTQRTIMTQAHGAARQARRLSLGLHSPAVGVSRNCLRVSISSPAATSLIASGGCFKERSSVMPSLSCPFIGSQLASSSADWQERCIYTHIHTNARADTERASERASEIEAWGTEELGRERSEA